MHVPFACIYIPPSGENRGRRLDLSLVPNEDLGCIPRSLLALLEFHTVSDKHASPGNEAKSGHDRSSFV